MLKRIADFLDSHDTEPLISQSIRLLWALNLKILTKFLIPAMTITGWSRRTNVSASKANGPEKFRNAVSPTEIH